MRGWMLWMGLLASAPAVADEPVTARLRFADCELGRPGTGATLAAECASLAVAEDPARPQGRRISLRIARVAARAAEPRPDPVVYIAGGPGQSATESYAGLAAGFDALRETRDIVFMDQRGTGGSEPLLCELPETLDTSTLANRETQIELARRCLRGFKADVRHYTTSDAVRDLEALRQALGAPQLNLYGGSYGTRVAQEYARRYPAAVRSLILDGVVPPALSLGSEHSRNLESAVKAILGNCEQQADCRKAFGNPYRSLYALRDRLRGAPYPVVINDPQTYRPRELKFDEGSLVGVVRMYAYQPESAALLPLLLHEAQQGRPQPLVAQAALLFDSLKGQIMHGMQLSVICAEDAPQLGDDPAAASQLLGNELVGVTLAQCGIWPRGAVPADFHQPLRSAIPSLLLSGEYDPVTPPRYAEQVLAGLGRARHLVARGQGHIQLPRGCVGKLAARFVDSLDPAALDASCLDALGPTPFFLDYNGAAP